MQFYLRHPGDCCDESNHNGTSSKPNTVVRIDFYDKGHVLTPVRKELHVQSLNCVWLHLGEVVNSYYEPEMKYCMIQFKNASEAAFAEECFCNEKVLLDLLNVVVEPCAGTDYEVLVVKVLETYLLGTTFIPLASLDPLWVFTNV